MTFPVSTSAIPSVTTPQMIEVDRLMMDDYRIGLIQMMENAGRNLAHLTRMRFLNGNPASHRVHVLVGPGGNGGGALVAARRLACWGARVSIVLSEPDERFAEIPAHQLHIVRRMGLAVNPTAPVPKDAECDVILDGLIGYCLKGAPRGRAAELIRWANAHTAPTIALDTPSGLDAGNGQAFDPAITALATMTLALPKVGLRKPENKGLVGELYCADISVPPGLYAEPSLGVVVGSLFAESEILRLA